MRQRLVAGNWKMHGTKSSIAALLAGIETGLPVSEQLTWVVLPPFVYLDQVAQAVEGSALILGAQNLCTVSQGAYTGEVSAPMLQDIGCRYVLVGHSERRVLYGESDAIVAEKFAIAQEFGLTPILCVGESLREREAEMTQSVIERQVAAILALEPYAAALQNAVIAYEPVWAIGTGKTASAQQAQEVHLWIRQQVARENAGLARKLQIIYGGSVKASNAAQLFAMPDIDGALVGGAALQAEEFLQIGTAALTAHVV